MDDTTFYLSKDCIAFQLPMQFKIRVSDIIISWRCYQKIELRLTMVAFDSQDRACKVPKGEIRIQDAKGINMKVSFGREWRKPEEGGWQTNTEMRQYCSYQWNVPLRSLCIPYCNMQPDKTFTCLATILGLVEVREWFHMACKKCTKKVDYEDDEPYCSNCKKDFEEEVPWQL